MLLKGSSLLFVWALCSGLSANAYQIHSSCKNAGVDDKIEKALQQAFAYARAGADALSKSAALYKQGKWEDELNPPRPKELDDLIKNVFAHQDIIDGKVPPGKPGTESYWYQANMKNLKLNKVYNMLNNILENIEKPGQTTSPGENDVVLYCDASHLEFSNNKFSVFDKDRDNVRLGTRFGSAWDCSSTTPIVMADLAITWGKINGDTKKGQKAKYSAMMQICKGTVENIKSGNYDYYGSFRTKNPIGKWSAHRLKSKEKKFALRQIDALNQLDLLLLHELTHTRSDDLDDVKISKLSTLGIPTAAYRWDNIKALAKKKPYVDMSQKNGPDNNADTVAYFALGAYLMSTTDEEGAFVIGDDGLVRKLDKPVVFDK